MAHRQANGCYGKASEIDACINATIKATKELSEKINELKNELEGNVQVYHRQKSELKSFLADLHFSSGNHTLPSNVGRDVGDIKSEKKRESNLLKKGVTNYQKGSRRKQNHIATGRYLSLTGKTGDLNAIENDIENAYRSADDIDSCSSSESVNDDDDGNEKGRPKFEPSVCQDEDDKNCDSYRQLSVPKLPKISKCRQPRLKGQKSRPVTKFDIAHSRRRFSQLDGGDESNSLRLRVNTAEEYFNEIYPSLLTMPNLLSLDTNNDKVNLREKIQQWYKSISENGWFESKGNILDVKSGRTERSKQTVDTDASEPRFHVIKSISRFQRRPSLSRQLETPGTTPLLPSSQSRSRQASQMPPSSNSRAEKPYEQQRDDDDESSDFQLINGGFALIGTRVIRKPALPVARLMKDENCADDQLIPPNKRRQTASSVERHVQFSDVTDQNNKWTAQHTTSLTQRPVLPKKNKNECKVKMGDVGFEVKLSMSSSASDVDDDDDIRAIKLSHSHHECKVYRGSGHVAVSVDDPWAIDRLTRAQTRVVQRQRARLRRESYSYAAKACLDAVQKYEQMKWSMK